jgi:hypothetical protein
MISGLGFIARLVAGKHIVMSGKDSAKKRGL